MKKLTQWLILISSFLLVDVSAVIAGGGPENVLLVVNADSESSKTIANHYVHLRKIPAANVVYLNNIPAKNMIHWAAFRKRILQPILQHIQQQNLTDSVDYIVYSSGFPTRVSITDDHFALIEKVKLNQGSNAVSDAKKTFMARASITSLTYLADQFLNRDVGYMMLDSNKYFRGRLNLPLIEGRVLKSPFLGESKSGFETAVSKIKRGDVTKGIEILTGLGASNPGQTAIYYWIARAYAKDGQYAQAAEYLQLCRDKGWAFRDFTEKDTYFEQARQHSEIKTIIESLPNENYLPTIGFRRGDSWSGNGFPNRTDSKGNRYYLSTMLNVTSENGCTDQQAIDNLLKTCDLDGTQPNGTYYFTNTKNVRTRVRAKNALDAIEVLNSMDLRTEIVNDAIPENKRDVLGLNCGTAVFDWTKSNSKIVPGAICDNLTSAGGSFEDRTQTKLTQFLIHGAAGASGTVVEPYAIQAKFPLPMIHVHYARGASLAESFYQSVSGPFQLLVVGDPLCQPFAKLPRFTVTGIEPMASLSGKVNLGIEFESTPVRISDVNVFIDGTLVNSLSTSGNISIDTNDFADGFHELRIVGTADNLIASRRSQVLSFAIDNKGRKVKLTANGKRFRSTDEINLSVSSNHGNVIELWQNSRILDRQPGRKTKFRIQADVLGNGPVQLTAAAVDDRNQTVSSAPLVIRVAHD